MVSKMKFIFLNLILGRLLLLSQVDPSVELVGGDLWSSFLALLTGIISTVGVQILRQMVVHLKQNKILSQILEKQGNGGVPSGVPLLFRSNYFRIAERINLGFRELERLITTSLPGNSSLLQRILQLQAEIYHDLEKRFYRRG